MSTSSLQNILSGYEEYTLDVNGNIISSNLEVVNITGYEEWEVIGKHVSLFYGEAGIAKNQWTDDLNQALHKGKLTVNAPMLKKNNIPFLASVKIVSLKNSIQAHTGFRITLSDAMSKAFNNTKLKRIQGGYINLFENSVIGIFKFNPFTGKVLVLNQKAQEILGMSWNENLTMRNIFDTDTGYTKFVNMLLQDKKVSAFEFSASSATAESKWLSIDCKYFAQEKFAEGVVLDITNRKVQELEVFKLKKELDDFIYHASHDLRSPLSSILGLINLINMANPTKLIEQYSKLIHERVHHMDILLKDLSTITFNNHTAPVYEQVHLAEELANIVDEFSYQNDRLKLLMDVNNGVTIFSDIMRFRTIIRNLLSNGIKYHNPMITDPYVIIRVTKGENKILLKVEDNGIGMDDGQLMRIYSMFNRGHHTLSGSGLGLYIVKSMVERIHGKIKFTSRLGKGTQFMIELPISPPETTEL